MRFLLARRALAIGIVSIAGFATALAPNSSASAAPRPTDPAQVVPLDQIAPQHREQVAEVIRDHTFHRKGEPETFPCHPKIYLSLLNEPGLTLALWQDLSTSPVKLRQVGPGLYQGTDGAGATATWEFVIRTAKLHVLLCNLEYTSPRGNARLEGRIVLIVHTGYYREVNGDPWVQHDVEAFVKIDSRGWKAVARTVRPVIEKLLEDQVREAGWFVSLMGRLVAMYPNWACEVTLKPIGVAPDSLQRFRESVVQNRRPNASTGRPALVDNVPENTRRR
ncbi:MAG: hypothetical protein P4L84_01820 [Isosphaeraceae bacterium]|nr:hypothetical protein [Isosphaeraceae bacterium]